MRNKQRLIANESSPDSNTSIPWLSDEKATNPSCRTSIYHTLWILLGFFLLFGCLQIFWAPTVLQNVVHDGISDAFIFTEARPNDSSYKKWISNDLGADSIPIKVYLHFYNVTNPADLINGSLPLQQRLPQFNLTPPIVYTQYFYRENVSFSADGTQVRSFFKTKFYHDEELSQISESDVFTIIGPLVDGVRHLYESQADTNDILTRYIYDTLFAHLDQNASKLLFTTATVRDLVFDVLELKFPVNNTNFLHNDIPAGSIVDYTYGLLKNGSGNWYVTHTGYREEKRMGEVLKWSNQPQHWRHTKEDPVLINFDDSNFTYIDCWYPYLPYSPAHFIYQGVWAIKENVNNLPPFFVSTLKKPLIFDYDKAVHYKGIPAQQYNISTGRQFMNETLYPPNAQYFQFGTSGVFNMTHCFNDLPLFFSLPKFYGSPDFQVNNSKMKIPQPNIEEDNGFLQVEPMTGAILNANVALQGNIQLNPLPNYGRNISNSDASLTHLPANVMTPTYLLRYAASLPDRGAKQLKKRITLADDLNEGFYVLSYVCMGLSALYWSYSMYWIGKNGCNKFCPRRSDRKSNNSHNT